ncbi:iron transporter [Pseudoduganella sp. SL102]|uniref:iron transporter n=1 Tax=Pseudoduganella sp. SL102 TaxID=2995154 RepID=UPI00248C6E8D|nr:iron transporter [Pseudoduganella sp. SL102]WBS03583.1 iron transporter [Pseudoduganella sp. SL102]
MQAQPTMGPPAAKPRKPGPGWRYRTGVAVRALAAILGGYALSGAWAAALALTLPTVRVEAALTATMTALAIYPCAAMWCFGARTAQRAVTGLAIAGVVPAAILLLKGAA